MQKDVITKGNKDIFCGIDKWYGLTMSDIRMLEDQLKNELDAALKELGHAVTDKEEKPESTKSTPF